MDEEVFMSVRSALVAAEELFLPRECLVCGAKLCDGERHLCAWCEADLPLTWFWRMPRNQMADRYNANIEANRAPMTEHGGSLQPYEWAAALFYYRPSSGYSQLTQSLKYHGNVSAGRFYARMLGGRLAAEGRFVGIDAVLPVPLHWMRRWRRGYNQAEVIAGELSSLLDAPLRTDVLRRVRRTKTQTRMSMDEKCLNVAGAFAASLGGLKDGHVLLVDDVFTSGSTMSACHSALRKAGFVGRISAATLAFVG